MNDYEIAADEIRKKEQEENLSQAAQMCEHMNQIFTQTESGKALLDYFKDTFVNREFIPISKDFIEMFGGSASYSGYCAGRASVIHWIELQIKIHQQGSKGQPVIQTLK